MLDGGRRIYSSWGKVEHRERATISLVGNVLTPERGPNPRTDVETGLRRRRFCLSRILRWIARFTQKVDLESEKKKTGIGNRERKDGG